MRFSDYTVLSIDTIAGGKVAKVMVDKRIDTFFCYHNDWYQAETGYLTSPQLVYAIESFERVQWFKEAQKQ